MKRLLALFLAVIMCLSLIACGEDDETSSKPKATEPTDTSITDNNGNESTNDDENTAGSTSDADWLIDGGIINAVKIRNDAQIVELTTENWREHFKVYYCSYSYDEEKVEYDTFGDVVSTEIITHEKAGYVFGAGNARYHWYSQVAIELKDKATGETTIYEFGNSNPDDLFLEEEIDLDNYECTRVKGSIYYWDWAIGTLPAETVLSPFEGSKDGMPYPVGFTAKAGTNAINYSGMDLII